MAYVSLYRKYRPQTFDEVVGQHHVTRTLVNALAEDRLSHAYLFTGPRGTGKTSTARILAKALNCEQGPTPTPCGSCGHCTAIAEGSSVDVIELDMASHGGVDDARELRDRALFAPATARRKVYILDEVHMASTAAFNALLKLIEEPPAHVLFAMATTDPQKVLPTILSRVQRLDLRRVPAMEVAAHVRAVCTAEGYGIEDDALDAVVRAGDGSVRDTLSVLEQVLAFGGDHVTAEAVAQTLGSTPAERVLTAVDLLGARDLAGLLGLVQDLLDEGHDLRRFSFDLVGHVRDLLVLQVAPDREDLIDATEDRRRRLAAQSTVLPRESLLRAVDLLADAVAEQRLGSPRLPLELALARLAVPGADDDLTELTERVARLEAATVVTATDPGSAPTAGNGRPTSAAAPPLSAGSGVSAPEPGPGVPQDPGPQDPALRETAAQVDPGPAEDGAGGDGPADDEPPTDPTPAVTDPSADPADDDPRVQLELVRERWPGILELLKQGSRRHHAIFEPAVPIGVGRGLLTLRFGRRHASFHAVQARSSELSDALRAAIAQACGLTLRPDVRVEGEDERRRPLPPSVTPDDARTPVLDDAEVDPEEAHRIREAEAGPVDEQVDVDALLTDELGARLVDEQPADDARRR